MSPGKTKQAVSARNTLWTEIWAKRVLRADTCECCGCRPRDQSYIHAHHDDYSRPLDVRWLCASCHTVVHLLLKGKVIKPWCTWVKLKKWKSSGRVWTVHKTREQAVAQARALRAKPGWTAKAMPRPIPVPQAAA